LITRKTEVVSRRAALTTDQILSYIFSLGAFPSGIIYGDRKVPVGFVRPTNRQRRGNYSWFKI